MATPNAASDMAGFFDFGEAAMPDSQLEDTFDLSVLQAEGSGIPENGVLCQPAPTPNESTEFNTDFSNWLPRYQKPAQPCAYCRSKSLECFIYNSGPGQSRCCSPCNALFRSCSFSNPDRMPKERTALDTLDVVTENDAHNFGGLTGRKQMRSLGHMGPIEDEGEQGSKKEAAAARFPRATTKVLKDWMIVHVDYPYPTEEEKENLMQQTGLSLSQISNWMANTRRRQKARPKRSSSPSIRPSTEVINIPVGKTWESMNPFERWKHSPPENEPAPMMAIAQAVETFDPPESTSLSSSYHKDTSNNSTGSFSIFKAPSISSLETGLTNRSSGSRGSYNSAFSYESRHSLGSMNSLRSKERRRRRRLPTRAPQEDAGHGPRLFQCTFCTDKFKSKYDWSRHEKSLHLSLEKWLCAPIGEIVADKATGKPRCVYCDELDPSKDHLATHNHTACYEKGPESRTFYRKDHLRQHLRLMHGCKMTVNMESWKSEAQYIKSRCGFCNVNFDKWQDRVDHLAKEFRNGANMRNWKGCRGLAPHVAMHVTNAMPPYLIGNESISPFPFSASNSASLKKIDIQHGSTDLEHMLSNSSDLNPTTDLSAAYQEDRDPSTIGPITLTPQGDYAVSRLTTANRNATCWEILTLRLGEFAREQMESHGAGSVTDATLQSEARNILYGNDDPWEQTSADNPEWLNLFKKAHSIDTSVSTAGISTYHEIYEDLGIHANTTLDPSFNIENFPHLATMAGGVVDSTAAFNPALAGSSPFPSIRPHSSGPQSPHSLPGLTGSTTASSTSPTSQGPSAHNAAGTTSLYKLTAKPSCPGPCYGENGEVGFATKSFGSFQILKNPHWMEQTSAPGTGPLRTASAFETPSMDGQEESTAAGPFEQDLGFLEWNKLDVGMQDLNTSSDALSMGASKPVTTTAPHDTMSAWDDGEMDFAMDLDMDFELSTLGNTG